MEKNYLVNIFYLPINFYCNDFLSRCNSIEEIRSLREAHAQFQASLSSAHADFDALAQLDKQIKSFNVGANPYTWFTMEVFTFLLFEILTKKIILF